MDKLRIDGMDDATVLWQLAVRGGHAMAPWHDDDDVSARVRQWTHGQPVSVARCRRCLTSIIIDRASRRVLTTGGADLPCCG